MKPVEARETLEKIAKLLASGQGLPPAERSWLVGSLITRLRQPGSDLERLLGLRSRAGGRLHAHTPLPARDAAVRKTCATLPGTNKERARNLLRRLQANNPELLEIERKTARLPRSVRQLERIIAGRTVAATFNN